MVGDTYGPLRNAELLIVFAVMSSAFPRRSKVKEETNRPGLLGDDFPQRPHIFILLIPIVNRGEQR